jgi:cobalt/nickel transport system ATP-binding protein
VFGVNPARQYHHIRERLGILLQNVDEQILAPTVWDDVSFSPRNYGYTGAALDRMVDDALERVGISHLRHKVCHHLSGGEKRKVALAGAIVLGPELLVLDEPFEGLDPASRADLRDLLNDLHRNQGVSLVMATHDVDVVPEMADRAYVLVRGGEIVAQGAPADVFRDPDLLRRSNIEPPALTELFARLEAAGMKLGRPLTIEDAARAILTLARHEATASPQRSESPPAPAPPTAPSHASAPDASTKAPVSAPTARS